MWQKKTKIKVIPINSAVDIHPKMDDLLIAYQNQTTRNSWKIIQTSPKNWSRSLWRGPSFKALSW